MNRDYFNLNLFPLQRDKEGPRLYGKRTGLTITELINKKRDPYSHMTPTEQQKVQADIDDLIGLND